MIHRNQKQLQLQLQGPDANVLARLGEAIADSVRATSGAVDVGLSTQGWGEWLGDVGG